MVFETNCRRIKIASDAMKLWERVIDQRLRPDQIYWRISVD